MGHSFKILPFQMTYFKAENIEHIFSVENQVEDFFFLLSHCYVVPRIKRDTFIHSYK